MRQLQFWTWTAGVALLSLALSQIIEDAPGFSLVALFAALALLAVSGAVHVAERHAEALPWLYGRQRIPLAEAEAWLYANSEFVRLRATEPGIVDGLYPSLRAYLGAAIQYAGVEGVCVIWAPREPGFAPEPVSQESLSASMQVVALGGIVPGLVDGQISRADLAKVRDWLEV